MIDRAALLRAKKTMDKAYDHLEETILILQKVADQDEPTVHGAVLNYELAQKSFILAHFKVIQLIDEPLSLRRGGDA